MKFIKNKIREKISPLKDKPLRYSAQSLDEEIDRLFNEKAIVYVLIIAISIGQIAREWYCYYYDSPPSPKSFTAFYLIIIFFCSWKIIKIIKKIRLLKLGRDGERAVGQYLDLLIEKECRVYHDIIGENFNIDHVILSRKGIFLIETKTFRKPSGKSPVICFDGEKITSEYFKLTRNPVHQVEASRKWLKKILAETTGRDFRIKPVIVFPGWYIETTCEGRKSEIWVLNPKALPSFIENEKDCLTKEEMMLASYHISRYIRTK